MAFAFEILKLVLIAVIIFILVNLILKTTKFLFKVIITLIVLAILYFLII